MLIIRGRVTFLLANICQAMIGGRIIAWGRGQNKGRLALSATPRDLPGAAELDGLRLEEGSDKCLADDLDEDDRYQGGDVDHADAGDDVAQGCQDGLGELVEEGHERVARVDGEPGEDRSEEDEGRKDPGQDLDEGD